MPKRVDLRKILIIGSGPIIIGQGCEFDYSGVQACKALKKAGYQIVLVNSNPATIMTDPELADHTYIEAITWENITAVIAEQRPDAILSTMGGQTALNCALELEAHGILKKYNVELIGACKSAIDTAENRELFRIAMQEIGLEMAKSFAVDNMQQAFQALQILKFPIIIRPSYTLGGSGGGIAYNLEQFQQICSHGFDLSRNHQLLIEESLLGWKEYELEVIRDANDSCIIVCTIENLDPMGIHTGDSITVAPAQTLTDVEYQKMRNAAIAILRKIGVQTGGSNVQFAVDPNTGRMVVIEMNPRVSRSSALASKATGFPIAKVAALLAVGYTLDELQNDITGGVIPASFEPTLDYVVVKIPRFNFEKFPKTVVQLTTQMQAIGEVMAIGSTFAAALQKALCSLELDLDGFNEQPTNELLQQLINAGPLRILHVADAFRAGYSMQQIFDFTKIDPWFLDQIQNILNLEDQVKNCSFETLMPENLLLWKQQGFSDARIAHLLQCNAAQIRELRLQHNITVKYKRIDSCAAEFPATTAYLYATYEGECEAQTSSRSKVIVLGSGPNRIGQGIEFDYCCVHAVQALQEHNIEAIMINCNPETVSTDYDISDRLYFESLTLESVLDIVMTEQPIGVILQLGGQTPLKLAHGLQQCGVTILGTAPDAIDLSEDRGRFSLLISKLKLLQPENGMADNLEQGATVAQSIGYPVMVRPSYVLGGRNMQVIHNISELNSYLHNAFANNNKTRILIDRFLMQAKELDVDVIADGIGNAVVVGIMEHIEPAGVHSGDSAAVLPPFSISSAQLEDMAAQARLLALELNIIGLMNIQFAIQNDKIYVLEVNPRASRTVPFVSKSIGIPVAKLAVACMLGKPLKLTSAQIKTKFVAVKQSVFPFIKFPAADPLLGPEMRSTGEVMSFGKNLHEAYGKSLAAAGAHPLKLCNRSFVSVCDSDKIGIITLAIELVKLGFELLVCHSTYAFLTESQIPCTLADDNDKVVSLMASGQLDFVISTKAITQMDLSAKLLRSSAIRNRVCLSTTLSGAWMVLTTLQRQQRKTDTNPTFDKVYELQRVHKQELREYENEY